MNEANNSTFEAFEQLEVRTKKGVYIDYNPTSEFWALTEVKGKRNDVDFLILTYLDNEALDQKIVQSLEQRKNRKGWWQVYGLGQLGEVEGKIYKEWQIIEEIPYEARLERIAIDFGYSNDPTAIVAIYYYNGGYILHQLAFQKGLSNKMIADIIIGQEKIALSVADSAEPKSIDEIRSFGVQIVPAEKGKDSVVHGIQMVQDQRISITKSSVDVIHEYRNYLWMTDKDGRIINEPEHTYSHSMDAIRYGIVSLLKQPTTKARQFIPQGMSANRGYKAPR
jgi:phage terminase large subunit